AVPALSAEGNDVAASGAAFDDVGGGDRDDGRHGLVGDVGEGRQDNRASPGPGGSRGLLLGLGARSDLNRAGHDHPEDDRRADQGREGKRSLGGVVHGFQVSSNELPTRGRRHLLNSRSSPVIPVLRTVPGSPARSGYSGPWRPGFRPPPGAGPL